MKAAIDLCDLSMNLYIKLDESSHRLDDLVRSTAYNDAIAQAIGPKSAATSAKVLWHHTLQEKKALMTNGISSLLEENSSLNQFNDENRHDNIIYRLPPSSAITPDEPVLSIEEPDNSLSMGDEHLDIIPATKSDEFIKSGVEDLIPIPSESEGTPEHVCDVPSHDNSPPIDVSKDQIEDFSESNEEFSSIDDDSFSFDKIDYMEASPPDSELVSSEVMEIVTLKVGGIKASNDNPILFYDLIISGTPPNLTPSGEKETNNFNNSLPEFTTFLKVLFDAEWESDSSDDQSCFDEDVLEKIISKPLCEEEIIPMKSLHTHDSSLLISSKIDSLLYEFVGELTLLKSSSPGIDEGDCDFEEDIRLIEKLLYDNSSPRPPKEFFSVNSDATSESFSPSPILLRIVTLLWRKLIYSVLRTTQCRRALRTRIMTLKGIFSFLRTCLAITSFHLLKKSHSILIFFRFLVLLQNHQMVIQES
nr:hypothetical protein [Tanacetum cinerariifolium]